MQIQEQLLNSMVEQQKKDNEAFLNMAIEYDSEVEDTIVVPEVEWVDCVSRTEIHDVEGVEDTIELRRFIKSRLVKVQFDAKVVSPRDLIKWFELKDEDFYKCRVR